MSITIREAETEEDRFACYRLRYEVYVEEMQRHQAFADHAQRITKEPYDDYGRQLLAEVDGEVVAAMRLSMSRDGPLECEELYHLDVFGRYYPDEIGMITKFIVRPDYRKSSVTGRMAMAAYRFGRENGISFCIIDSYPHLVQLYLQLGYRFFMKNIPHPDYGSVIPMVLVLEDIDYFKKIRSPFYRLAREYDNGRESCEFFAEHFSEYLSVKPFVALTSDDLFSELSERIASDPGQTYFDFLKGMDEEEVATLISHLPVIQYDPGEFVFKQGDQSLGMFCILSGQIEVVHNKDGEDKTVAILSDGDIFGEMGFVAATKRLAAIRVREHARLMVISPNNLDKVMSVAPVLTNKLLVNLFRCVVERYAKVLNAKDEDQSVTV